MICNKQGTRLPVLTVLNVQNIFEFQPVVSNTVIGQLFPFLFLDCSQTKKEHFFKKLDMNAENTLSDTHRSIRGRLASTQQSVVCVCGTWKNRMILFEFTHSQSVSFLLISSVG